MKHLIIKLIEFYQNNISSKKKTPCCKFHPTCSTYTRESLETFGFLKGSVLAIFRLLRCSPLSNGGYDPVGAVKLPKSNFLLDHFRYFNNNKR
ncbi:MAG: membrane protein insertion efficiency factor YidD [Oscillospiraceae bacterium]|jgi:putative membrane protein insertion efficiency factor|nr:membrane protein insertion efficiency factor YidD [Oscillospiraceae bacterium]